MTEQRRGLLFGLLAYGCWGFFPLYFHLLSPTGPPEIVAHRIVWSALFMTVLLGVRRHWGWLRGLTRRQFGGISLAAAILAVNWGFYLFGISTHRVVEASLGYFIYPLLAVLLGVFVLKERLRRVQWYALGIGAVAVAVLSYDYGRPPYIALALAVSFALYGLIKKKVGLPAAEGLFIESMVLALPALGYLGWVILAGTSTFGHVSLLHTVLLIGSGLATAIPLMLFAGAANRLPMSMMGILQYLSPVLQLASGVLLLDETLPPLRLAGFALVWVALVVFTVDGLRSARRSRQLAAV